MALLKAPVVEVLKDGVYDAVLSKVDQQFSEKNQREFLIWQFVVTTKRGTSPVEGITSLNFGPKSKARPWVEALLGRKIAQGEEIDTDELTGCECKVWLGTKVSGENGEYTDNTIEKVTPRADDGDEAF